MAVDDGRHLRGLENAPPEAFDGHFRDQLIIA